MKMSGKQDGFCSFSTNELELKRGQAYLYFLGGRSGSFWSDTYSFVISSFFESETRYVKYFKMLWTITYKNVLTKVHFPQNKMLSRFSDFSTNRCGH